MKKVNSKKYNTMPLTLTSVPPQTSLDNRVRVNPFNFIFVCLRIIHLLFNLSKVSKILLFFYNSLFNDFSIALYKII